MSVLDFSYNATNKLTQIVNKSISNDTTANIKPVTTDYFSYDENNNLIYRVQKYKPYTNIEAKNQSKTEYTYDSNLNCTNRIDYSWAGTDWVEMQSSINYYKTIATNFNFSTNQLDLFPNRAINQINFYNNILFNNENLIVTDAFGRTVIKQTEINGKIIPLNISNLSQGVYFINVSQNGTNKIGKFIKY